MHDQIEQKRNKLKEMIAQFSENDRQAVIWATTIIMILFVYTKRSR